MVVRFGMGWFVEIEIENLGEELLLLLLLLLG